MTFGSLFKKPETILYPVQKKEQPIGLKGSISITVEDCILCGMCDRSCPTDCLTVDKQARTWSINRYQCIQCGYCVTVCPKNCLSMDPDYAPAAIEVVHDSFEIPETSEPKNAEKPEQAKERPEKAPVEQASAPVNESIEAKKTDSVLEAKLAIMDPEKAEKVRKVLAAR